MANDSKMTDLGMTKATQSSAVQPTGPSKLQMLLGDAIPRYEKQIVQIDQAIVEAQAQKKPGILDKLLSPAGILTLLGTGGLAATGHGREAAAFGAGGMQGTANAFAQQEAERQKMIAGLQDQLESAKKELDNTRQRLIQVWQREPEAFLTPEGKSPVSPEMMGYYLTGTTLPVSIETKRALDQMDLAKKNRLDAFNAALAESTSLESAKLLTERILAELGNRSPDPNLVQAMASSYGTPEQEPTMARVMQEFGPAGFDAIIYAHENQLSYSDPQVWSRMKYDPTFSIKLTAEQQLEQQIVDTVNQWAKAHPSEEREIKISSGDDAGLYWRTMVNLAYEGQPGDIARALSKIKPKSDEQWAELLAARRIADDRFSMANAMAQFDKLGMTQEEIDSSLDRLSNTTYQNIRTNADRVTAERNAGLRVSTSLQVTSKLNIDPDELDEGLRRVFASAREAATQPDGTIDPQVYARMVREKTAEFIQDGIDAGRGK